MKERLAITIEGSIAVGITRPVRVAWKVTAPAGESAEAIAKAIDQACAELNAALLEALK